jgi:hypothetical protein
MATLLAPAFVTACSSGGNSLPEQDSAAVAAAFAAVIEGCSAGLTPDGGIDQSELGAAGWKVAERSNRGGVETSSWQRDDVDGLLELVRYGGDLADSCMLDARAAGSDGVAEVLAALSRKLGAPARQGVVPQGGDQLTPRATEEKAGYYWPLPTCDIYLTAFDDQSVRIEVLSMPDRDSLDPYSPDRPESRIITEDQIQ